MLAGAGGLGCIPPLGTSFLSVGSRAFLSPWGPLPLSPVKRGAGSGSSKEKVCWQWQGSFPFPCSGKQSKP